MDYKVLVKLIVPEVERSYELYIPVNRTILEVIQLSNQLVHDDTDGIFPMQENIHLCNRFTSEIYASNVYVRDTNIRNGSQLVLF
jgi:hypothetical protein